MKKFFFCVSLALAGLMTSCVEKYEEVDADSKPSWLGGSIYAELKNPDPSRLTGTFNTYLRLVDDLGYAETLNRTGSKTVFPANDEAFERFFASNDWGVGSYEQLSEAQKKLLLYTSMLDNALLLGMLPNVSNGTAEPLKNSAVKHATNVSIIDSVQHITDGSLMPQGNTYWDRYRDRGIYLVSDNTRPMMVHLTREYMLGNDITTLGSESDFAIITGTPYSEGNAYVFNVGIQKNPTTGEYNGDRTCLNGYIHQMEDVIVPPGNMGQVLRSHANTTLFSRILDHYAVPYYDETTTRNYNDWAMANGRPQVDSIYQMRYLSTRSQDGNSLTRDPNGSERSTNYILNYDPGWNQYYPKVGANGTNNVDNSILDVGAFFVPDDQAVKQYFLPGGGGAHLIEIYGSKREGSVFNDEAHLMENLDSLHARKPEILASFVRNLLKPSFAGTVPSKFPNVTNDASENMGLTLSLLDRTSDGRYDITIANNGVVYVINDMIVPDEFRSVMAPASQYPDMRVMNWAIQDGHSNGDYLGLDFKYYLMAMSANYAFFIPQDNAFNHYYIDPASLGHAQPEVLHFYFDSLATKQPYVKCTRYLYDMETGEVGAKLGEPSISQVKSQMVDILNFHTVVLSSGQTLGQNHYYRTKHGGEIYVENGTEGTRIMSGWDLEQPADSVPHIINIYHEKNGNAYRMDRLIQAPQKSVYAILRDNADFSDFLEACTGFEATDLLAWAGISADINAATGSSQQDAYTIFTNSTKLVTRKNTLTDKDEPIPNTCLDMNVKMFNTYHYTLFAPDNNAMTIAYRNGLPRWSDIQALFEKYPEEEHDITAEEQADMDAAKEMITQIRNFVRYHFMTTSVYADNTVESGKYQSLYTDATGVAKTITVSGGSGVLSVTDETGHSISVNAADTQRLVNKMARDYWFNASRAEASSIVTSSFCAVHQISEPLYNGDAN